MCVPTPTKASNKSVPNDDNGVAPHPWVEGNGDIVKEHLKKIFFGKYESLNISRVIKEKMCIGNQGNTEVAVSI